MKLIIAGGRDYVLTRGDAAKLDRLHERCRITEVVSGHCTDPKNGEVCGADAGGEKWAEARGIPIKRFPADWNTHGKAAGPMRNKDMAAYADAVVLFTGGRGTDSMHFEARKAGIGVWDWRK